MYGEVQRKEGEIVCKESAFCDHWLKTGSVKKGGQRHGDRNKEGCGVEELLEEHYMKGSG